MAQFIPPIRVVRPHDNQTAEKMPYKLRSGEKVALQDIVTLETLSDSDRRMAYYHFLGKYVAAGLDDYDELRSDSQDPIFAEGGLVANRFERLEAARLVLHATTTVVDGSGINRPVKNEFRVHPSGMIMLNVSSELDLIGYLVPSDEQSTLIDRMISELTKPID